MKYTKYDVDKLINFYKFKYVDKGSYYVLPTYCHHHDGNGSQKLYIYFNDDDVLFHCYTNCGTMSLVGFLARYLGISNGAAFYQSKIILGKFDEQTVRKIENPIEKLKKKKKPFVPLKEINDAILNQYYPFAYEGWTKEHISPRSQRKFGVRFSVFENKVIIPQKDKDGKLVGVRARALNPWDIEEQGKYKPIYSNGRFLSFEISENLYGLYENKQNIINSKQAILFEAEKSVMQMDTYFNGKSNALALSGSNISDYQMNLLGTLGVNEIVVALDKEYRDEKELMLRKQHIYDSFKKYKIRFNITVIMDDIDGLLQYKDSPSDRGKDTFITLFRKRKLL